MLFLVACKKTQDSLLKILDSTLWIPDSRYWIPGFWIPRSGSRIPGTGFQDSWFHAVDSGFQALDFKILDSTPWIPDSRHWIPHSLSVELGFWIPVVTPELNSGFHDCRSPVQSPWFSLSASKNFTDYLTWSDFIVFSFVFVYIIIICHNQKLSAEPNMEKETEN